MLTHAVDMRPLLPGLHLLLRWQPSQNPDTIVEHRKIAEENGSVWWGKIGDPARAALSQPNLEVLKNQLSSGLETHVYLYRPGELWRTRLEDIATEDSDVHEAVEQ